MKKNTTNISNYKRLGTLFLGIIMALVIVVGQVAEYQAPNISSEQEQQDSQQSDDSTGERVVLKATDAIATSVQVNLSHQYYFISEIIFADESDSKNWHIEIPVLTTFLHTIFRQIISPNAP